MNAVFRRRSARPLLAAAAALTVAAMGAGLYLQYAVGLEPCPLCVLQRVGFVLAGLIALLGALAARGRVAQIVASLLALVATLAGGGVAVWHTWLTMFPPASFSCGRPVEWFHDDFLLAVWLPKLFRGAGDCLHQNWTLLGLSIPQWSVLVFAALLALLVAALWRAGRAR
ncbi:MAG: disulfide bond formation protein B [Betaproteobacteria bacterium]